jgi:excisionase family DNA binding protein
MDLLTTNEAAKRLHVTPIRIRQMIREGKIEAKQVGRDYVIEESSLDSVKTYGKAGRPKGGNNSAEAKTEKSFKTIFDVVPELAGKYDDLPSDLSTNKEYLKDLGKKSSEKNALQTRNRK